MMKTRRFDFGTMRDGQRVEAFALENGAGLSAEFISYGAAIRSVMMRGRDGRAKEITYGFDTLAEYEANRCFFGAAIGRFGNRIARGAFSLDGRDYTPVRNDGGVNHLHGGDAAFDRQVWQGELFASESAATVAFSRRSPAWEEGYPGNLDVRIEYTLTGGGELVIDYRATADAATPFNPVNHAFWNLAGADCPSVLEHELELNCPFYLPVNSAFIPTGEVLSVKDTPMDFLRAKPVGRDIGKVPPAGYDHCFVIAAGREALRRAAILRDPGSGRTLEVLTTMPGVQVYSGNNITPVKISGGYTAAWRGAICLETEFFPDSVNRPHFPSAILRPGAAFFSRTVHRFSIT